MRWRWKTGPHLQLYLFQLIPWWYSNKKIIQIYGFSISCCLLFLSTFYFYFLVTFFILYVPVLCRVQYNFHFHPASDTQHKTKQQHQKQQHNTTNNSFSLKNNVKKSELTVFVLFWFPSFEKWVECNGIWKQFLLCLCNSFIALHLWWTNGNSTKRAEFQSNLEPAKLKKNPDSSFSKNRGIFQVERGIPLVC